jgi:hypothetical protein
LATIKQRAGIRRREMTMSRRIERDLGQFREWMEGQAGHPVSDDEVRQAADNLVRFAEVLLEIHSDMRVKAWAALHDCFPSTWPCCCGEHSRREMTWWATVQRLRRTWHEPTNFHDASWACDALKADVTVRVEQVASGWLAAVPVARSGSCGPEAASIVVRAGAIQHAPGPLEHLVGQPWMQLWPAWEGWSVTPACDPVKYAERERDRAKLLEAEAASAAAKVKPRQKKTPPT